MAIEFNEEQLIHLELQIESLLESRDHLKSENNSLRHKLSKITQERAMLAEKNKTATSKIKKIIGHLKEEIQ